MPLHTNVSMKGEHYQKMILNQLLPDIAKKCPYEMWKNKIYIQHDNAPAPRVNKKLLLQNVEN